MTLFARHYRYVPPLPARSGLLDQLVPRGPDPIAIGDLSRQRTGVTAGYADGVRHCHRCGVSWHSDEPCFACGARVPELTL